MTEPHDPFDTWLHARVEPLPPPPGTFEHIRKRARRRKAQRALASAASAGAVAAVIAVAVVTLPRVVPTVLHLKSNPAAADHTPGTSRSTLGRGRRAPASHSPAPSGTAPLPPVPPNFAPSSVTFVGLHTGWVIGQAGTPGHCYTQFCTSIARTDDAGASWHGVPAPETGGPDGSTGVSQIRFLNTVDGWAFGPQLWATHDGGQHWTQVSTGGMRVTSLETVGGEAFAVFARCAGTGADFAASCTQFWLYSSPAGSNDWRPVPGMGSFGAGPAGRAGSATIVLTQGQGYLYTPDGTLLSGPVTGTSPWQPASPAALPCSPGAAQPDGRPAGGQLAASATGDLALVCPPGAVLRQAVFTSVNGGQTWQQQGSLPPGVSVTSLAAGAGGVLAVATTQGIEVSADGGQQWQAALQGVTGGFSYVGLTSQVQGVAVPADPALFDSVWFTTDGGQHWQQSPVRGG